MQKSIRTFNVNLTDSSLFSVVATYGVSFDYDNFSCWVDIHSVRPMNSDACSVLNNDKLIEIEQCIANIVLDEHETMTSFETIFTC